MAKIIHPLDVLENNRRIPVFCKIEFDSEKGTLSISGVIGPRENGDCVGSCGQIEMSFEKDYPLRTRKYAKGWNAGLFQKFLSVWREWHLNDLQAGCVHQRAAKWVDQRIPVKDLPGSRANRDERGILAIWVYPTESTDKWVTEKHPDGLLTKPCPECGYKYGSAWLKEEVPADVLKFLESLPESDKVPAWV